MAVSYLSYCSMLAVIKKINPYWFVNKAKILNSRTLVNFTKQQRNQHSPQLLCVHWFHTWRGLSLDNHDSLLLLCTCKWMMLLHHRNRQMLANTRSYHWIGNVCYQMLWKTFQLPQCIRRSSSDHLCSTLIFLRMY